MKKNKSYTEEDCRRDFTLDYTEATDELWGRTGSYMTFPACLFAKEKPIHVSEFVITEPFRILRNCKIRTECRYKAEKIIVYATHPNGETEVITMDNHNLNCHMNAKIS